MSNYRIPYVADGDTFKIGDMEFIKFPSVNGTTPVVMKDIAFTSRFGDSNDLNESIVLTRMKDEILPKIIAVVGEENLCSIKTDLTAFDGLKPYEDMESLISLPTLDFYRANVAIFDRYNPKAWWWLATPHSAQPHYDPWWVLCVVPSGYIYCDYYYYSYGVRPFCILKSNIFVSV